MKRVCGIISATDLRRSRPGLHWAQLMAEVNDLDELYVLGSSSEWPDAYRGVQELTSRGSRRIGLTFVARGLVSMLDLHTLLSASADRRRTPALHIPLFGDEQNHDRIVGVPGHFRDCINVLLVARSSARTAPAAILPLGPDTISSFFPVWHTVVSLRIRYMVTVRSAVNVSADLCYWIAETLENLAHHPSVKAGDAWAYAHWGRELSDAGQIDLGGSRRLRLLGSAGPTGEAQQALLDGIVALPRPKPPLRARLERLARNRKVDKAFWLSAGCTSIVASRVDGSRKRRPAAPCSPPFNVLVIGWYGTETAGDKAILGGIAKPVLKVLPEAKLCVASSKPFYTQRTLTELGLATSAQVVPYHSAAFGNALDECSLVLIGGGPLMDLVEMFDLVRVMHSARRLGKRTLIAGCGVGPVEWPITRWAVAALVDLSDRTVLRDAASLALLREMGLPTRNVAVGVDPAFSYVSEMGLPRSGGIGRRPRIGVAVRAWPWKFARHVGKERFLQRQEELIGVWADVCDRLVEKLDVEVHFIPMHTLYVGDDDRWLHAEVRARSRHPEAYHLKHAPASARSVAEAIAACDVMVCMRYHSLLFTAALGVPAIAVDYTGGGKVAALATEWLKGAPLLKVEDMSAEGLAETVDRVLVEGTGAFPCGSPKWNEMGAKSRLAGETAVRMLLGDGR